MPTDARLKRAFHKNTGASRYRTSKEMSGFYQSAVRSSGQIIFPDRRKHLYRHRVFQDIGTVIGIPRNAPAITLFNLESLSADG